MNMPGMTPGAGAGMHPAANLIPDGLAIAWAAVLLLVAGSHLRHMMQTTGQRRSWHACHVLMALGMAFMYTPVQIDPLSVPSVFWQFVFAAAGLIAAAWAIGGVGRVSTLIWLLTSIDLAVMLYMSAGSKHAGTAPLTWLLAGYLVAEAGMWALDIYRRLDGATPIVSWRLLAAESGDILQPGHIVANTSSAATLLGSLDIAASMIAMTLGMAYMLVAMQLMA